MGRLVIPVLAAVVLGVAATPATIQRDGSTLKDAPLQANTDLRLYLARHGQTDWNAQDRLQGSTDVPLNATGREQSAQLAERLAGVHLDAVYSSQLQRSRQSAEIARGSTPLISFAGLNERRLGGFEGQARSESYLRRSQDPADTLDGGESLSQFFARIENTLSGILARHRSGAILIVGHGATNQMIVRSLFHLTQEQAAAFQQSNEDLYLCDIPVAKRARLWKLVDPVP